MKPGPGAAKGQAPAPPAMPTRAGKGVIHPVIIYPYQDLTDYSHLEALYEMVAGLDADRNRYARPITVVDRKTYHRNEQNTAFLQFRKQAVAKSSQILDAWCVDTCQMWYCGLTTAFEAGGKNDVFWLIPGDFNYGSPVGQQVLSRLHDLPEIITELDQDLCIGEVATSHHHPKQVIDTYGTFALLYNWFPTEAKVIRQVTERPRSEFFAVRHSFLREVLRQRWYAYEQTVVMLLLAIAQQRRISRFFVGEISDLPENRESLHSALQQVERTERLLKSLWRERHATEPNWTAQYEVLESRSDQIRKTAFGIFQGLLA